MGTGFKDALRWEFSDVKRHLSAVPCLDVAQLGREYPGRGSNPDNFQYGQAHRPCRNGIDSQSTTTTNELVTMV